MGLPIAGSTPSVSKKVPETVSASPCPAAPSGLLRTLTDPDRKTSVSRTRFGRDRVAVQLRFVEIEGKYVQRARANAIELPRIRAISKGRKLLGLSYRKRFQDQLIDQREDRRVGSDAQSKGNDSDQRKSRLAPDLPQRISQVMDHTVHACTSAINFLSSSSATTLPSNK